MSMHFNPEPPPFFPDVYLKTRNKRRRTLGKTTRRAALWLVASATRLCESFGGWLIHRHMTQELHALDDRMLADIGISRCEIQSLVDDAARHKLRRSRT